MPTPLDARASDRRVTVTGLAATVLALGLLAVMTPLSRAEHPESRVGWLLGLAAGVEVLHALRRSTPAARRGATVGAVISMVIAFFLINAPYVASQALRLFVAGWFALDMIRHAIATFRRSDRRERLLEALAAIGNAAVVLLLLLAGGSLLTWVAAVAGAFRILGIAWNIMVAPVFTTAQADETVVTELGLTDQPEAAAIATEVEEAERARAPVDRGWTLAFVVTLFAIHIGRMETDLTILGLLSPAVAVLGDMVIAVLITLVVINPVFLLWRAPTRWIERRVWRWHLLHFRAARAGLDDVRDGRMASVETEIRDSDARGSLLDPSRIQPGASNWTAHSGDRRGNGPGLGHELVLRHRKLGGRDMEFLGGVSNRQLAGGYGRRP